MINNLLSMNGGDRNGMKRYGGEYRHLIELLKNLCCT
jgi:hypothetical protein